MTGTAQPTRVGHVFPFRSLQRSYIRSDDIVMHSGRFRRQQTGWSSPWRCLALSPKSAGVLRTNILACVRRSPDRALNVLLIKVLCWWGRSYHGSSGTGFGQGNSHLIRNFIILDLTGGPLTPNNHSPGFLIYRGMVVYLQIMNCRFE